MSNQSTTEAPKVKVRKLGVSGQNLLVGVSFDTKEEREKGIDEVSIFDTAKYYGGSADITERRLELFWDLMDTLRLQGYLRAAVSVVGRSAIGPGWELKKDEFFMDEANDAQAKRLRKFYSYSSKKWTNIKDWYNLSQKLLIASQYLKFFGQAAFHILRNENGTPLGLDFLFGLTVPNVNDEGEFKEGAAFYFYPSRDPSKKVKFTDPRDVLYIINPSFDGSHIGASDSESLVEFNLPLSIYLNLAARKYMENRDRPELVYELPADISDEAFDEFVEIMEAEYSGANNIGKNPVVVAGELNVKEISNALPKDLPYGEARQDALYETLAVTGATTEKLGIPTNIDVAGLKERRREFHETTMLPLFRLIQEAFYEQIHVREFNVPGWRFIFSQPDFLTAVERATVHMRYGQQGVLSPNEIRNELGLSERTDKYGDEYVIPNGTPVEEQGSPPEGREDRPDAPGEVGEPTLDDQDPPRGDDHDDVSSDERFVSPIALKEVDDISEELRAYQKFLAKRNDSENTRDFIFRHVPNTVVHLIDTQLELCDNVSDKNKVFKDALREIKYWYLEE